MIASDRVVCGADASGGGVGGGWVDVRAARSLSICETRWRTSLIARSAASSIAPRFFSLWAAKRDFRAEFAGDGRAKRVLSRCADPGRSAKRVDGQRRLGVELKLDTC